MSSPLLAEALSVWIAKHPELRIISTTAVPSFEGLRQEGTNRMQLRDVYEQPDVEMFIVVEERNVDRP